MPKRKNDDVTTHERRARNKAAFVAVLGDPFEVPEIEGMYLILKRRSSISATQNDFSMGRGTHNPANPSILDFFCDVENVIERAITDKKLLKKFIDTYIMGDVDTLTKEQRAYLEQRVGQRFFNRRLHRVKEYFNSVRRPVGTNKAKAR